MATAISANKAELLAIADAVAREKLIDKAIVIEAECSRGCRVQHDAILSRMAHAALCCACIPSFPTRANPLRQVTPYHS